MLSIDRKMELVEYGVKEFAENKNFADLFEWLCKEF